MTASPIPLALVIAFGSALSVRLLVDPGARSGREDRSPVRSEANRDIERRLDRVVHGPSVDCGATRRAPAPLSPDVSLSIPQPQPCSSPEPWRKDP